MRAFLLRILPVLALLALVSVYCHAADDEEPKPPPIIERDPDTPDEVDPGDAEPAQPDEPQGRRRQVRIWKKSPLGVEAPPGMVYVPAGLAPIGTPTEVLEKRIANQPTDVKEALTYETPEHQVPVAGFFMGQFEVTNAQYLAYLKAAHAVRYVTTGAHANLDEIAAFLLHTDVKETSAKNSQYTLMLYLANKKKLHETLPDLVVDPKKEPLAEEMTYQRFRRAPLPRDLVLDFYDRLPPLEWEALEPSDAQMDLPVRSVSYFDVAEFAEWAGVHVPTEVEWEYAARGPEGYIFPWGDFWTPNAERANWGGKIIDERYLPTPIPVDANPPEHIASWPKDQLRPYDGMSWCGVWHLIGNVWEYTSSWFTAYPGNKGEHHYMGEYVKVLRGGGFTDVDPLVLRASVRNWRGIGDKGPPVPANRFSNVGFRIAWSGNPGQDRLEPVIYRATRGRRVNPPRLDLGRWAGVATHQFADTQPAPVANGGGTSPEKPDGGAKKDGDEDAGAPDPRLSLENHVYVTGPSYGIVLIPLQSVFTADDEDSKVKRRADLDKLSEDGKDPQPIPLAVFHTDIGLQNVYLRDYDAEDEKSGGRRRRKPEAPKTEKGKLPPGTYILAFWFERLCLVDTSLDFQCFFSTKKTPASQLRVEKLDKEATLPPTTLNVEPVADTMEVGFGIPIGGARNDEDVVVLVNLLPDAIAGRLESAGTWKQGRAKQVPMPQPGQPLPPPDTVVPAGGKPASAPVAPPVDEPKPEEGADADATPPEEDEGEAPEAPDAPENPEEPEAEGT